MADAPEVQSGVSGATIAGEKEFNLKDGDRRPATVQGARW